MINIFFFLRFFRARGKKRNNTRKFGFRCDACEYFLQSSSKQFLKNKRGFIVQKFNLFNVIEPVCSGTEIFDSSDKIKEATSVLLKTQERFLTKAGQELKAQLNILKSFFSTMRPPKKNVASSEHFITKTFGPFYEKYGDKFRSTLIYDLLLHQMKVMEGKTNSHIGQKSMNFFMFISTASAQASRYCAANLFGPNIRSLRRHCKKVDQVGNLPPITNQSIDDIVQDITAQVHNFYTKDDTIAFSTSIDGTRVGEVLQVDKTNGVIVGGVAPNHHIVIPDFTGDAEEV